jgi:hypothetical protein
MKKYIRLRICALFLSFLGISALKAQPVITPASHPIVGEIFHYIQIAPSNNFTIEAGGTSKTWDYTTMPQNQNFRPTYITDSFVNPASAPCQASFTGSNLANIQTSVSGLSGGGYFYDTNYYYHIVSANSYMDMGFCNAKLIPTANQMPQPHWRYPLTYQSAFDTALVYVSNGDSSWIYLGMEGDAYGTLKLPGGTYQNVLRIAETTGFVSSGGGFYTKKYSFYNSTTHDLLMSISFLTDSTYAPDTTYSPTLKYLDQQTVNGISAFSGNRLPVRLFPNPSHGICTIEMPETVKCLQAKIYSATGKLVYNAAITKEEETLQLDFLPKGIYIIQLNMEGSMQSQKLIIE